MALPKRLADILKVKNERLESIPDAFQTNMVKVQKELLTELIAALGQLDRSGGFITLTKSNLIAVEEIANLLGQIFTEGEYLDSVTALANEFDEQALINDSYFKELDNDFTVPAIADDVFLARKAEALENLLGTGIASNVSAPIKRELVSAVTTGASYSDTLRNIQALVTGTETTDGLLMRYTRQLVSDSFAITDRSYTSVISEERGYDWFLYSGGLMDTSRNFCIERNGKFFHRKEVESWGNIPKWDGRMKGTNSRTIFTACGGYGCQHACQPVSVFAVPKVDVERNIKNGNYKPSKVESELLD
jgi:hypothetical protein